MPITFRYPALGGTGAVSGGDLVVACGQYSPPGPGATTTISGMVYSGTPTHAEPPPGASVGSCNPMSGTWQVSSCMHEVGTLTAGTSYTLRVWQRDSDSGSSQHNDCDFTACEAGSGDCWTDCAANAPGPVPGPGAFGCESIVISHQACRKFRVLPTAGVAGLMEIFGLPPLDHVKFNVVVTYDEKVSTHDRAIWVSPSVAGQQLRLEVARGGCCYQAVMTRVRIKPFFIETLDRWGSTCFDIIEGGELCGLTANCLPRDGGVQLVPIGEVAPAPPLPEQNKKRPARARRARRGKQ